MTTNLCVGCKAEYEGGNQCVGCLHADKYEVAPMKNYEFTVRISGMGDKPDDAWEDAVGGYLEEVGKKGAGPLPDPEDILILEDEVGHPADRPFSVLLLYPDYIASNYGRKPTTPTSRPRTKMRP